MSLCSISWRPVASLIRAPLSFSPHRARVFAGSRFYDADKVASTR
jgi:hypothetical protein